jgi:hypothetical protein
MTKIRWCLTHMSEVIAPEDDPDTYWLCYASNYLGDTVDCEIVEAEVTWLSQS